VTKILVIDDDAIVRKTIVQILEQDGYQVLSAEDGARGMVLFRSEQPDLVITDIIMPEQEGIQTITEMRRAKPDAKIIAISGGGRIGNTDFLQIALVLGAMDVVPVAVARGEPLASSRARANARRAKRRSRRASSRSPPARFSRPRSAPRT
jgi:CheY-like chemotaxis protein